MVILLATIERPWDANKPNVLECVNAIEGQEFLLADMYAFEGKLQVMHPDNHNIRPKIRQQLQVLRDRGLLEFVGRGRYRKVTNA